MSGNNTKFDDDNNGDLRDSALRRALDHAPDSDARPDPRTRDAILKMAHNLAEAPVTASPAANSASAAPWWRRLFGGGGEPRARMPWNAAFATVLVAGFVAVLWHREPVPDARLDGEARVGGATAQAPAPVAPAAPAPAQASAEAAPPAEAPAAAAAPPPVVAQAPAAPAAEQRAKAPAPRDSSSPKKAADAASADALQRAAPKPSLKQAAPAPVAPAEPVTPSTPPAIVAEQSAPAPVLRDERREARVENERRSAYAAGAPAPAAPPPPAAAPANQDSASAELSGGLSSTAPGAAAKAMTRPRSAAASFSALERWTSFNFTRSGASVRHERGDIEGLPALVSTVARSATSPDEPLAAPVEARLELHRGNAPVAVLEIAGGQVRWTSQPGGAALVGTPPAQALDALRSLLMR
ncbi:hypothetical protein SAMN05518854_108186 [Variovorax sp. YR266]|uniref:hypothetical protein n=1 Tax=Variovorax sp. YR266 TaxID=1884386 RepID=UPI00089C7E47|nr:hypothetical protein [Variovorax sp. YR266]SDZ60338.1 hypothetical protein SAMN05518854_108186 [Variovorax sp. YR266]